MQDFTCHDGEKYNQRELCLFAFTSHGPHGESALAMTSSRTQAFAKTCRWVVPLYSTPCLEALSYAEERKEWVRTASSTNLKPGGPRREREQIISYYYSFGFLIEAHCTSQIVEAAILAAPLATFWCLDSAGVRSSVGLLADKLETRGTSSFWASGSARGCHRTITFAVGSQNRAVWWLEDT